MDLVAYERDKIKGAIRTDFILSAEIIVLTLGVVANMDFTTQVLVVSGIAIIMTVGVYGLVAGIVKLDDAGLYLLQREGEGAWGAHADPGGHPYRRDRRCGRVRRGHPVAAAEGSLTGIILLLLQQRAEDSAE